MVWLGGRKLGAWRALCRPAVLGSNDSVHSGISSALDGDRDREDGGQITVYSHTITDPIVPYPTDIACDCGDGGTSEYSWPSSPRCPAAILHWLAVNVAGSMGKRRGKEGLGVPLRQATMALWMQAEHRSGTARRAGLAQRWRFGAQGAGAAQHRSTIVKGVKGIVLQKFMQANSRQKWVGETEMNQKEDMDANRDDHGAPPLPTLLATWGDWHGGGEAAELAAMRAAVPVFRGCSRTTAPLPYCARKMRGLAWRWRCGRRCRSVAATMEIGEAGGGSGGGGSDDDALSNDDCVRRSGGAEEMAAGSVASREGKRAESAWVGGAISADGREVRVVDW
uniref:Uncharacterized protein n=1 Tax=Oryza punctata TaxID=4537 RepID=A0A0E0KH09_ORYPU